MTPFSAEHQPTFFYAPARDDLHVEKKKPASYEGVIGKMGPIGITLPDGIYQVSTPTQFKIATIKGGGSLIKREALSLIESQPSPPQHTPQDTINLLREMRIHWSGALFKSGFTIEKMSRFMKVPVNHACFFLFNAFNKNLARYKKDSFSTVYQGFYEDFMQNGIPVDIWYLRLPASHVLDLCNLSRVGKSGEEAIDLALFTVKVNEMLEVMPTGRVNIDEISIYEAQNLLALRPESVLLDEVQQQKRQRKKIEATKMPDIKASDIVERMTLAELNQLVANGDWDSLREVVGDRLGWSRGNSFSETATREVRMAILARLVRVSHQTGKQINFSVLSEFLGLSGATLENYGRELMARGIGDKRKTVFTYLPAENFNLAQQQIIDWLFPSGYNPDGLAFRQEASEEISPEIEQRTIVWEEVIPSRVGITYERQERGRAKDYPVIPDVASDPIMDLNVTLARVDGLVSRGIPTLTILRGYLPRLSRPQQAGLLARLHHSEKLSAQQALSVVEQLTNNQPIIRLKFALALLSEGVPIKQDTLLNYLRPLPNAEEATRAAAKILKSTTNPVTVGELSSPEGETPLESLFTIDEFTAVIAQKRTRVAIGADAFYGAMLVCGVEFHTLRQIEQLITNLESAQLFKPKGKPTKKRA